MFDGHLTDTQGSRLPRCRVAAGVAESPCSRSDAVSSISQGRGPWRFPPVGAFGAQICRAVAEERCESDRDQGGIVRSGLESQGDIRDDVPRLARGEDEGSTRHADSNAKRALGLPGLSSDRVRIPSDHGYWVGPDVVVSATRDSGSVTCVPPRVCNGALPVDIAVASGLEEADISARGVSRVVVPVDR